MSEYITIPLSKTGKLKNLYETIVSEEDAILADFNWQVFRYSKNLTQYAGRVPKHQKPILIHRAVMERILGHSLEAGQIVDHINHNGLDNRRENLRLATHSQNVSNRRGAQSNNKSGYKGVSWSAKMNKWQVHVQFEKRKLYLGSYSDIEEAHKAYCEKAKELFGEFWNAG